MHITSKEQAKDKANIRMGEGFTNFINHIEFKIATTYVDGGRVLIYPKDIPVYRDMQVEEKASIRQTALGMYRAQGWDAQYQDSQRDGPWIELK